jgi:hypothetical protein
MKINIDNYEEIMFRLVEDDFDKVTRMDLLKQIETDELFKFEWQSWQKTSFVDPLENYATESQVLTDKILQIAEPKVLSRKRFFFYWAAAASLLALIGSIFIITAEFNSKPKQVVSEAKSKHQTRTGNVNSQMQNTAVYQAVTHRNQLTNNNTDNKILPVVVDSNTIVPNEIALVDNPKPIDSLIDKTNELAKVPQKKLRYTVSIETTLLDVYEEKSNAIAQNRKVKLRKVFTHTRLFLQRKENGEPDKIILMGDENNYLCINLNYSEK